MSWPFAGYPDLLAGFSGAADGTMALNGGFDRRRAYLAEHGLRPETVVHAGLCHGTKIAVVTTSDGGTVLPDTDGLITTDTDVGLAMTAADCLLLSVVDAGHRGVGLVHAGRRGLAAGVLTTFIDAWRTSVSTSAYDCFVQVSPSICVDHYTVSEDDAAVFSRWPDALQRREDGIHLDLRAVARAQLRACDIPTQNIFFDQRCTFEERSLFSYRRDHPAQPELQVGYLIRG